MLIWALKNWRLLTALLAILSVIGTVWYYGHREYRKGYDQCTTEQAKAEIKGVNTHAEIKSKNNRAAITDVDKRLIDNWLRQE